MLWHLLKEIRVVSLVGCRAPNRFHFECSFCGLFQLEHSHRALVSLNSVFKGLHIVFLIIWMTEIGVMLSFFRYLFSHFYSHCLFFLSGFYIILWANFFSLFFSLFHLHSWTHDIITMCIIFFSAPVWKCVRLHALLFSQFYIQFGWFQVTLICNMHENTLLSLSHNFLKRHRFFLSLPATWYRIALA